jgi:PAS domain S-box-containing protein
MTSPSGNDHPRGHGRETVPPGRPQVSSSERGDLRSGEGAGSGDPAPTVAERVLARPQRIPGASPETPGWRRGWAFYPAQLTLLAAVYFGTAKFGLTMAFVAEQVTAVWPPTGIALAALLVFGYRVWPGIALGAFLANATANEPLGTAAGIALGNTLEALLGAWLLRSLVGFDTALERVQDVLGLVVLAAGVSPLVSATIGATSLCLGGVKPWTAYNALWSVWWLGDALGVLVVAPLLLTWAGRHRLPWRPGRVAEAGALLLGVVAVSLLVFAGPTARFSFHPLAYAVFPFAIWAALRFGQPGATLTTFATSGIAIWGTARGSGPFAVPTTHESLVLLQVFMGVVAVTTLVLAAVTLERERAKEAARQSRDELRLTLEAARVGTWNWDPRSGKLCWSDNLEAIHGLAPGTFGGTFEAFLESVLPEDRDKVLQAIRSALAEGKDYEIEYRSVCPDGTRRWVGGRGRMIPDAASRPRRMHGICSDITPRKQAAESLRQSYELLRAVTEGTTDAVFVKDRQGRYLMINTAGARLLGKTVAEVLGKQDTELFSAETARAIVEGDRRIMATGEIQTYEDVGTAAGVTRTYLSTKGPYRDAQGNILGVIGISLDISERKQAEDRFRLVVESAPSGMLMINRQGRIVLVNAQTEMMFGYGRGELLGQPVELLVPERFRGGHPAYRAGFFANPTTRVMGVGRELYGRRRDGSEFPVEIGLTPIAMAEGPFVLSAIADITERKRAEETRARLAAIVESSEDAILSKNLDGIILTWNRAAEKMYGYPAAEVVGRPISLLIPPERAGEVSALLDRLRRGERVENYETVRLRKDGARIEVSLNLSPMPDAAGRVTGASVVGRDITARKRSERRLAAMHAVTCALARFASLEEAAAPVLQAVGEALGCDLGVLWEVDAAADLLRCAAVWHAPGVGGSEFGRFRRQIAFARGEGLPGRTWGTEEPAWVADAAFPRSVAAQRKGPCGALALPLRSAENILGVLEFFSPDLRQPDADLVLLLTSLGSQIAQFIERRHAEMVLHSREREFSLARTIQQGLFPKAPPVLPGFAIAGASDPTQETGGDYFDFIPLADGQWGIAVGDASGHGIGPALLIAETRAYLRALALTHTDPGQVLDGVNQRLVEDITEDHFVTLFLARLNPLTRSLVYASAGHVPGYVLDGRGEGKLVLRSTGLPLGLERAGGFPNGPAVHLDPGDLVFLLSDGIVEAPSGAGAHFGIGRALEVVRAHRHDPPGEIVAALLHQVHEWSQSAQVDDMTAVVIKVGG